ncbi:uncharacterized protein GGS22DRAFT_110526 [Annulohypoxylon maeteangense]|uniref:uncharacterized protein n=1 Tax=Annulohypoxylon maeteangense TaxID=1927788 RepID=UPI0020076B2F|nr:uncharacterized protein GGS22DRAFT_110526 [Annulohypoxylon maeteangense]KAI0887515.1 hypothetical protein GGS22DRAFT_110526 [Annulohypoxylon maeteangense]
MSSEENNKNTFVFSDEESRPQIYSSTTALFSTGEEVELMNSEGSFQGTYFVELVFPKDGQCTLCFKNGRRALNGKRVQMDSIRLKGT